MYASTSAYTYTHLMRVQIPEELLLSAATARHQSRIGHLMEDAALPAWSAIALYLIELRRNGGRGREELGLVAEWGPWLSVLPDSTGCVLDWSQQASMPAT